jgi:hypothetical protein
LDKSVFALLRRGIGCGADGFFREQCQRLLGTMPGISACDASVIFNGSYRKLRLANGI